MVLKECGLAAKDYAVLKQLPLQQVKKQKPARPAFQ